MTTYNSLCMLVPDALVDDANRLFRWFGRDEGMDPGATFNVPRLSPTGEEPRTFGCTYDSSVPLEYLQAWIDMKSSGTLPTSIGELWIAPDLSEFNLDEERALAVIAGMELSLNQSEILPPVFVEAILAAKGLQIIQPEI